MTHPTALYHFTCEHGFTALGYNGYLRAPLTNPTTGLRVIWLTTEANPDRTKTGLTSSSLYASCDRMKYRYIVAAPQSCIRWLDSTQRANLPKGVLDDLERFGDPEHWWITEGVLAYLDGSYLPQGDKAKEGK